MSSVLAKRTSACTALSQKIVHSESDWKGAAWGDLIKGSNSGNKVETNAWPRAGECRNGTSGRNEIVRRLRNGWSRSAPVETVARSELDKYVYPRISTLEMPIIGRLNGTISDLEWYLGLDSLIYVDCRIKRSFPASTQPSSMTDEKPTESFRRDRIHRRHAAGCPSSTSTDRTWKKKERREKNQKEKKKEKREKGTKVKQQRTKEVGTYRKHCFYERFQPH